ncbi:MAG TPA: Mur ligase family protein [Candidatus Dormibacteraeota bacterium]|nr:Mur ligase family protein [Candidatus Dormibacteraeota bacterium]
MATVNDVTLVELRVLDGPNLYFTRPAIKLTLAPSRWLALPGGKAARLTGHAGFSPAASAGAPGSEERRRYVARFAVHLLRTIADATGTHLAVRGRPGPEPGQIVIAFPWRRRAAAEALGRELASMLELFLDGRRSLERAVIDAADRIHRVDPGPAPEVSRPTVPVVSVTGTNGKTTTVRLIAHLARSAGHRVAYTTTDGVYRDGELVEAGDYSGYGGAAMALAQPEVSFAVLETARGSILLRGIGTEHNDVAVVTNVTADHLDQYGIRTLDQLAEVKAAITRITRPEGWDVLNADDPRVLAMRRHASGQPWLFSLDPDHPAIRGTLAEGGRAITVLDKDVVIMSSGRHLRRLLPVEDIPVTLAGISSHNISNAMAAAAAALGAGVAEDAVIEGLRSFVLDPERNPGRANIFDVEGRVVVVDYAHNEDGMRGLVEICQALRPRGARVFLAFAAAGDRTDRILHQLGYTAARGADRVAIAELQRYLRGRDPADVVARLQAGAVDAGKPDAPVFADEMEALEWMLRESGEADVIAVTALAQRPEIFRYLGERGGTSAGPDRIKALVKRARGV